MTDRKLESGSPQEVMELANDYLSKGYLLYRHVFEQDLNMGFANFTYYGDDAVAVEVCMFESERPYITDFVFNQAKVAAGVILQMAEDREAKTDEIREKLRALVIQAVDEAVKELEALEADASET